MLMAKIINDAVAAYPYTRAQLAADLPALLHGQGQHHGDCTRRLSDTALVKLFRLLRLARRLLDLEAGTTAPGT